MATSLRLLLVLAFAGVAGRAAAADVTVNLHPVRGVTCWDEWSHRWWDIADNPFDPAFRAAFSSGGDYTHATVAVTYQDSDRLTLRGTITAQGLKPNFAYQVKLVGKPTREWGTEGDDWSNQMIGQVGRWWRYAPTKGNAYDSEYAAYKDTPGYIFEGYLLSTFFVTDGAGCAEVPFAFDSSYHVLWKTSQRARGANDSQPVAFPIRGVAEYGYTGYYDPPAELFDGGTVSLYLEHESGRALGGALRLPDGRYRVRFLLTEESFHNGTSGDGGKWQSAMIHDDVRFRITPSNCRLGYRTPPYNTVAGMPFSRPVQIVVVDDAGRRVTDATDRITIAIGRNVRGARLSGTTTVNAVNGIATFPDLSLDRASGEWYSLVALAPGMAPWTSARFYVSAGPPVALAFAVQPRNVRAGAPVSPAVRVVVQDACGNTVSRAADTGTLALATDPGGAALSGTTSAATSGGAAWFGDVRLDKPAAGYTLRATSAAGLRAATSAAFTVLR